jgi:hypothetical protein
MLPECRKVVRISFATGFVTGIHSGTKSLLAQAVSGLKRAQFVCELELSSYIINRCSELLLSLLLSYQTKQTNQPENAASIPATVRATELQQFCDAAAENVQTSLLLFVLDPQ